MYHRVSHFYLSGIEIGTYSGQTSNWAIILPYFFARRLDSGAENSEVTRPIPPKLLQREGRLRVIL